MTYAAQPQSQSPDLRAECDRMHAETRHWLDRFEAELEFARGLAKALPREAAGWQATIDRAEQTVARVIGLGDNKQIQGAIESAERQLADIGAVAKTFTVHCVGHAHIDMNWMWGWHETVATTVDTFETVLKLMDEFPGFTFSQSQASVYEIAREFSPDLFARIKKRVQEGRWEITASHWVEGDHNIASGESLCRHLLYTRRYMQEHFGLKPEDVAIDWSPDTFGHAHTIPSIDARGAVKYYYCCRTGDPQRPPAFWWKSPDGSKVLVNREILWYNSEPRALVAKKVLEFHEKTTSRDWLQVYGIGDHGGGPTRRDLRCIVDMNQWPIFPSFRFSTAKAYFAKLEKVANLPVLDQELNYEFSGCYTSQAAIKKANRLGENLMSEADAAAALSFFANGRAYPAAQLRKGWCDVLFSHFHDILPGSGVRQTREYNSAMTQNVQALAGQIRTQSLRTLAKAIDTSAGGKFVAGAPTQQPEHESMSLGAGSGRADGDISLGSIVSDGPRAAVVFNPTAWERKEIVRYTIWDADVGPRSIPMHKRTYQAKLPDGTSVRAQIADNGDYWGHKYVDLVFPAVVGGNGWSTYQIVESPKSGGIDGRPIFDAGWYVKDAKPEDNRVTVTVASEGSHSVNNAAGAISMENDLVKVRIDRRTGAIASLVLKATGQEFSAAGQGMGQLEYVLERSAGMTAWVIGDTVERTSELKVQEVEVVDDGPFVGRVRVKLAVGTESTFKVDYELHVGSPAVRVTVDGTWLERGHAGKGIPRLQIRFPFALDGAKPRYEIPYGSISRDEIAGREVPALRWASLTGKLGGKTAGCAVLNDCKYGHSLDGSTLRVNLVRSSYDPDPLPEFGQQQARFAIVPFAAEPSVAELMRLGAAFNQPLQAVISDHHQGDLPPQANAVQCDSSSAIVTQIKRSEDGDSLVLRLLETAGATTTATVSLAKEIFGSVVAASECDVLERDLAVSGAKASKGGFSLSLAPHAIATVKVALKK